MIIERKIVMKRKIYSAIAAALIFTMSSVSVFGAVSDITINSNGILQPIRTGIFNKNGNNIVGLREMSEILDADDIFWDSKARTVTIKKADKKVVLSIDTGKTTVNNEEIETPVSAEIIDNSVFVPLRFISEIFDAKVDWNQDKKLITITTEEKSDYIMLDVNDPISENTKVYTYNEALSLAENKNSDLKNLDDTIAYLTKNREELGNNIKLMDTAYASYTMLENVASSNGQLSDSMALQLQITDTIDSTVKIMQGMKSVDVNKSLKDINAEMIKDSTAVTLKN